MQQFVGGNNLTKVKVTANNALLPTLLLVLFIGLKLTGVIAWSWFWVLSPFWIPLALALGMILVGLIIVGIAHMIGRN
jgi:hypothetical protein